MFAVQILVQAVVVTAAVVEHQRRWPHLPGIVAALDELGVCPGIPHVDAHRLVPAISDRRKFWPHMRSQLGNSRRQRITEVLVLAFAIAMARHDDLAAETLFIPVKC